MPVRIEKYWRYAGLVRRRQSVFPPVVLASREAPASRLSGRVQGGTEKNMRLEKTCDLRGTSRKYFIVVFCTRIDTELLWYKFLHRSTQFLLLCENLTMAANSVIVRYNT